jgi:hypothetical protein
MRSLSESFGLAETTGLSYGNGLSSKSPAFYGITNIGLTTENDSTLQFMRSVSMHSYNKYS